jgi:hypothetical protein
MAAGSKPPSPLENLFRHFGRGWGEVKPGKFEPFDRDHMLFYRET